ncbi:MAG TPA: alpha/beta fold hydrolase [candidate division Zixibacteria bacterium]|nr:alpha/beta fold hydrolase [candidate division Zixibacteria bacterium]
MADFKESLSARRAPADDPANTVARILQPPPVAGLFYEIRGFVELPRLLMWFPCLARQPRGSGQPVIVLPGYGAGNLSTAALQTYLRYLGYHVRGIGGGTNSGDAATQMRRVLRRVMTLARRTTRKVQLVGWSFGGYLAREAARERPDLVDQVITLGTPVVGGPKYTVVARSMRRRGIDVDAIALEIEARNRTSLLTPVTAIYSRADRVVAWEACLDPAGANVDHIEVSTTHLGLGFCPEVYEIIAQRLARGGTPLSRPPAGR